MKKQYLVLALLLCTTLIYSCKKEDEEPQIQQPQEEELIDPTDPDAISRVLIMPDGTQTSNGTPPAPTSGSLAPDVNSSLSTVQSSNGSTVPLNFTYTNVNGNIGGCYVIVDGASSYFTIPYTASSSSSGQLQLPLGIPTNVLAGTFCVSFCIYDQNGRVSNIITTCITVLRLGTGAVQVSLSWDTPTDQDLHVTDPEGYEIYYSDKYSTSGGELDRDDLDGYGPENIYWLENAPDGTYKVEVNDYEGTSTPNTYYITVSGPNTSKNFTGTTMNNNKVHVVNFTKEGNNISFQ